MPVQFVELQADRPLGLFEAVGIELEYMVVDMASMSIRPLADRFLSRLAGGPACDVPVGDADAGLVWSNELVNHVLELKVGFPVSDLEGVGELFGRQVRLANDLLSDDGACLLGLAMHPWMDPSRETILWPGAGCEIYQAYDRLFNCHRHGWSNLQSMHLNLPFADEQEFGRLHAAIRLVLPLIPALAAGSPWVDGRFEGVLDQRLIHYATHADRVPSMVGRVIPEPVTTFHDYQRVILGPLRRALSRLDCTGLLQGPWTNARGAIARMDRCSIEIRLIDIQESPAMDMAVAGAIIAVVRSLVQGDWGDPDQQIRVPGSVLEQLLSDAIGQGPSASVDDECFLRCFGLAPQPTTLGDLWAHCLKTSSQPVACRAEVDLLLSQGPLASRLRASLPAVSPEANALREVCGQLAECLAENRSFIPSSLKAVGD